MRELKVFINTYDIDKVNSLPNFIPLFKYVDEPKYSAFEYDRREWGRLYFGDDYITVLAQSDIK